MKDLEQAILRVRYTISAPVIAFELPNQKNIIFSPSSKKSPRRRCILRQFSRGRKKIA
jgi:hypothetical protein